ncbi:MAG: ankyrin repeat domain-containing protein [Acidobacteria bacterium]|nr:ankyrin repeat domain-containing protein [Acidobacteriota bacterium]
MLPALFTIALAASASDLTLVEAAKSRDAQSLPMLLKEGADPLLPASGNTTPLIAAAGGAREAYRTDEELANALEAVKLAVEFGADISARNAAGQTAMHAAAFTGADAIVQFLADQGASVELKDKSGETPWSMAMGISPESMNMGYYGYHKGTADLLVRLGASALTPEQIEALKNSGANRGVEAYTDPTAPTQ